MSAPKYAAHPDDFVVVASTTTPTEIWARDRRLCVLTHNATEADAALMAAGPELKRALREASGMLQGCMFVLPVDAAREVKSAVDAYRELLERIRP